MTSELPHALSVLPFALLLLMVATGPVFYPKFWHHHYTWIAPMLATGVVAYYLVILKDWHHPREALAEYIQFILLLGSLYMISGSILIRLGGAASPKSNLALLWSGAILANVIGTTGASMLLIRPYMRLNKKRISAYHIVFFIFMVSNVGGALTPIGDPPLFLGYLKGIDFFWPLRNAFFPWLLGLGLLSGFFYWLDRNKGAQAPALDLQGPRIEIKGGRYFLLFLVVIGAVFIDPQKLGWDIPKWGEVFFLRELILLGVILVAYFKGNKEALKENAFSLEPLKEVVFIFIGIFGTMMPALAWIGHLAGQNAEMLTPNTLYWGTGIFSSVLDNAPTYLCFLEAGMASKGGIDIATYIDQHTLSLLATSVAAVFFGAMTYIGNGPNFMVRAIAEENEVKMPSFFGYIGYALRFLLPVLVVVWGIFIYWPSL